MEKEGKKGWLFFQFCVTYILVDNSDSRDLLFEPFSELVELKIFGGEAKNWNET